MYLWFTGFPGLIKPEMKNPFGAHNPIIRGEEDGNPPALEAGETWFDSKALDGESSEAG